MHHKDGFLRELPHLLLLDTEEVSVKIGSILALSGAIAFVVGALVGLHTTILGLIAIGIYLAMGIMVGSIKEPPQQDDGAEEGRGG